MVVVKCVVQYKSGTVIQPLSCCLHWSVALGDEYSWPHTMWHSSRPCGAHKSGVCSWHVACEVWTKRICHRRSACTYRHFANVSSGAGTGAGSSNLSMLDVTAITVRSHVGLGCLLLLIPFSFYDVWWCGSYGFGNNWLHI